MLSGCPGRLRQIDNRSATSAAIRAIVRRGQDRLEVSRRLSKHSGLCVLTNLYVFSVSVGCIPATQDATPILEDGFPLDDSRGGGNHSPWADLLRRRHSQCQGELSSSSAVSTRLGHCHNQSRKAGLCTVQKENKGSQSDFLVAVSVASALSTLGSKALRSTVRGHVLQAHSCLSVSSLPVQMG